MPFAWRRVSSGAATMHRLHVMNDGSISTGMSMPLSMPNRLSASVAGRPDTWSRAGISADCTVRISEETSFMPVNGSARESISPYMARRLPSARSTRIDRAAMSSIMTSAAVSPASDAAAGTAARSIVGQPRSARARRTQRSRRTICSSSSDSAGGTGLPRP